MLSPHKILDYVESIHSRSPTFVQDRVVMLAVRQGKVTRPDLISIDNERLSKRCLISNFVVAAAADLLIKRSGCCLLACSVLPLCSDAVHTQPTAKRHTTRDGFTWAQTTQRDSTLERSMPT